MGKIIRIGLDTSKSVFQLHGVDAAEQPVLRRKLRREAMVAYFAQLEATVIGIEACGASHHWARVLPGFGHEVRLIPPQYVKPYVKRGKNDAADAEAICEAMSRPSMRFVPVKSAEQQADLMLHKTRSLLIRQRTQLANAIRGHAAEFGVTGAKGLSNMIKLLERIEGHAGVPPQARASFALLGEQHQDLERRIEEIDARVRAWHRDSALSQRLAAIAGVGPLTASLLAMKVPDPRVFKSGRDFAAWLGLTPKDHSTAGKNRMGVITRAGDEALRSLLVVGATAVIQQARRGRGQEPSAWIINLLKRKPPKLAAVALANKTARIAWKLMVSGETYRADYAIRPATTPA